MYRLVASGTVEERILERAEKKLLLDQMVNREQAAGVPGKNDNAVGSGMTASELLKDIQFGSAAVFGDSSLNTLPTEKDIDAITNRKRTEVDSVGNLKGNVAHKGQTFDLGKKLSESQVFQGLDFKKIREEKVKTSQDNLPSSLKGIARLYNEIRSLDKKRKVKNRIVMVDGMKSGYGKASVPVLAANNYELEKGESSVFGRELSAGSKKGCAVPGKKAKKKRVPENQEFCQHCSEGGHRLSLFRCSRCPVSCHKECWDHIDAHVTKSCSHHRCTSCDKPSQFAGGLLYPCQSCHEAWCEDCLPSDVPGFRFLGACERFERMGFDSTKSAVYIHCSAQCEEHAKKVFGWQRPKVGRHACPEELDVSSNFGAKPNMKVSPISDVPSVGSTETSSSSSDSISGDVDVEIIDITGD